VSNREEVVKAILKAGRAIDKARSACVEVDALTSTYWKSTENESPLHWLSADLRTTSGLLVSLVLHLRMRAEREVKGDESS